MEFARGEGHSEARLAKILQRQEEYCRAIEDAYRAGYESGYAAGIEDGTPIACGEDPDGEYIGLTD